MNKSFILLVFVISLCAFHQPDIQQLCLSKGLPEDVSERLRNGVISKKD